MAPLPIARRELFAQCLARGGRTQAECYIQAGFSNASPAGPASTLANDPSVMDRVAELQMKRADKGVSSDPIALDEIVTGDKIDEEWVLQQLQSVLFKAKDMSLLKVARDVIIDITAVKGIGVAASKPKGLTTDEKSLPNIGKTDLTRIAQRLEATRVELDGLLVEAIDITPEDVELPRTLDGNEGTSTELDGDSRADYADGEELQRETETSGP